MKSAIKIGDLYVVYDEPPTDKQGLWYEFGKELAEYYKALQAWIKPNVSKNTLKIVNHKIIDYSFYETPTVYRKWR